MNIVTEIKAWQEIRHQVVNKKIGFVPTMGNLHAGHISLCERAQAENEMTVVSIFVNPTQFNQVKDLALYPRTIEEDIAKLSLQKIDYLLLPEATSMYPDEYQIQVTETELSSQLEGEFRPGHFTGMLTIVLKLLNLVQPTRAYLGEKDYQQCMLVKKMVAALFTPVEVVACETIRAEDGLALSSRNTRLNAQQRQLAAHFPRLLQSKFDTKEISATLTGLGFKVEYIAEMWQRRLGAVWIDEVRLIDNVGLEGERACYFV